MTTPRSFEETGLKVLAGLAARSFDFEGLDGVAMEFFGKRIFLLQIQKIKKRHKIAEGFFSTRLNAPLRVSTSDACQVNNTEAQDLVLNLQSPTVLSVALLAF